MKSIIVLSLFLVTGLAFSDYAKDTKNPHEAQWMKNTAPGENHAVLKDFVGNWKTTSKFWMDPKSKPEESKGTQTNKLIFGGRFLEVEHKGTAMGKPFTGKGLLGYDNVRAEYQSVWVDSMSSSIIKGVGVYDPNAKTLTETGTFACPMTNEKNKTFRSEYKIIDKNHYTFSMYSHGTDGAEFKNLEINYAKN